MQLIFTEYYKRFGIRRLATMPSPLLFKLDSFPRDAIFHSVSHLPDVVDVDVSKPWYAHYKQKIETFLVNEINNPVGRPARMKTFPAMLSVEFFKQNRKFKLLRSLDMIPRDPMNLLVINYGYLHKLYRYPDTILADWYRWENIQKTVWETAHTLAQTSSRQQFIFVDLPKQPLGRAVLNIFMEKNDPSVAKMFDSPEERFVLDFWRWLNRSEKVKSTMDVLGPNELKKINLVFTSEVGLNCVLNLGYLFSWFKGNTNLTPEKSVYQQTPDILGKLFISLTVFLSSQHPEEDYGDIERSEIDDREQKQKAEVSDPLDLELSEAQNSADSEHSGNTFEPPISNIQPGTKIENPKIDLDDFNEDNLEKRMAVLDSDLDALNNMNLKTLRNKGLKLDKESNSVSDIASIPLEEIELDPEQVRKEFFQDLDPNQSLLKQVDELAEISALSAREYKNLLTQVQNAQEAKDPYSGVKSRKEMASVKPEELQLDARKTTMEDLPTVVDKSMLKSNLLAFDEDYINNVIRKDVLAMIDGIQKAGVIVKNHEVEMIETVMGRAESHTLELKPLEGTGSRIHFKIPKVDPDGTFTSGGSIYAMRKQRVDIPILKIDPINVALSSYYGKNFVAVSDKVANNALEWLAKQVTKAGMEGDEFIIQVDPSNAFDESFSAPYIYNSLASRFNGIQTKQASLVFNHKTREELSGGPEVLSKLEVRGRRFVGFSQQKNPIVVDESNTFIEIKPEGENELGNIYQVLRLEENKSPIDYSEMRVFSKTVPVAIILGYLIGLKKLFALLGVKPEVVDGKRYSVKEGEYALKFNDKVYVLNKKDRLATLILSGFLQFEKQLKNYPAEEFNNKDVYFNLLESKGLGSIYIREIELSDQLFVDHITKGVLEQMGEPTTFRGLLVRASEMLLDYHKKPNRVNEELKKQGITDIDDFRQRGYERIPGAIYRELTKSIRQFKNKSLSARSKIDMSPYQIWTSVMKDPSIKITEDINPVQNLKESESATFVGEGGRSKDSLNKASRAFRESDVGVVSEATVDSSDVGINVSLSADPMILNLRGLAQGNGKQLKPTNMFSSAALLAPGAANDDGKRTNFISIQQSHTIQADGYHPAIIRTGYENITANRTSNKFAYNARQDGEVVSIEPSGIIIKYKDGSEVGCPLGRIFGKAEGSVYPHDLVTGLKPGQKFKRGDNITYNKGFFELDKMNPGKVVLKNSMYVTVALLESNATFDDSSSISLELSQRMATQSTKVKSVTVKFKQGIHSVVQPGKSVNPKDVLLLIEDEITSGNVFDEESLSVLKNLSRQAPKSKYQGTIDKVEVFYHGDKEDMSPSLKALADKSDRDLARLCKHTGKPVVTGSVGSDYRVSGNPLLLDTAEIRIYITVTNLSGVGDKGVFGNQLKSVVGEVMDYKVTSESGVAIDAFYNFRGVSARIVESAMLIGTTAALSKTVSKQAVELYRGK